MKFKVGDKIKVIKSYDFPNDVGRVCRVTNVMPSKSLFACRVFLSPTCQHTLMYSWEIEKNFIKGEQLLFNFMQTGD